MLRLFQITSFIIALLIIFPNENLNARRGGGFSSGRSFRSSSSFRPRTSTLNTRSSSRRSSANRSAYTKAKNNGTAFRSKSAAESAFKQKYASQYPTRFTNQPNQRPSYIPRTYNNNNIVYNNSYGGYGYFLAGAWIMYNPYPRLMTSHGYYYGAAPSRFNFGSIILIIIIIVILLRLFRRNN